MDELDGGIRRVTLPLPTRPGHVHAYLLPGEDGWTLVDTGIGLPDAKAPWALELEQAGGRVATIFVTHFHPDHVGAAADLHELTGAPVVQGSLDYAQCELVWGNPAWSERLVDWFRLQGAPDDVTAELVGQSSVYRPFVRYQRDPTASSRPASTSTGGSSSPRRATPTGSSASFGTACWSPPITSSAGSRRPSGSGPRAAPIRWATTSPRSTGRSSSRRGSRCPVTAIRSRTRRAARAS